MAQRTALTGLLKFYFNIESAYYELMDSLEHFFPVYDVFINPLENRKIPSFPVYTVLALVALAVLLISGFSVTPAFATLELRVQSADGALLSNAQVQVSALEANGVQSVVSHGLTVVGRIFLSVPAGKTLVVRVEKEGFELQTFQLQPSASKVQTVKLVAASTSSVVQQAGADAVASSLASQGYPQFQEALQEIRSGG